MYVKLGVLNYVSGVMVLMFIECCRVVVSMMKQVGHGQDLA